MDGQFQEERLKKNRGKKSRRIGVAMSDQQTNRRWVLMRQSGGMFHYAIFRHKAINPLSDGRDFTIQFSNTTGGYGVEVPQYRQTARQEWDCLVAAGWRTVGYE